MFTLVVLIVTIVVCLSHVCFGHFKYLSAHNYKVSLSPRAAAAARLTFCLCSDRHQGHGDGRCDGERMSGPAHLLTRRQTSGQSLVTVVIAASHARRLRQVCVVPLRWQQQMYIAQVLQDPNTEELGGAGGGGGEEGRSSLQEEELMNGGNNINEADFQSGEDSLIANEVRQ